MILSIRDFDSYLADKMDRISRRGEQILKEDILHNHYHSGQMMADVHTEPRGRFSFVITTNPKAYTVSTTVFSFDAAPRSSGVGFEYAPVVRSGRRGFSVHPPKRALHWKTREGNNVFVHSVGPYTGDAGFPTRARDRLASEISQL